jgi:hypothetical protein
VIDARSLPADKRMLVSHLVGRVVLQRCAEVLHPLGIEVMPLKGLWLQHFVYGPSGSRLITDVDVLVLPERYREAQRALEQAGWKLRAEEVSESTFFAPGLGLPLDLHKHLYTRGAFRASAARIMSRGVPNSDAFECPILLPDPLDVFSHLVGHALKSAGAWRGTGNELTDIPRLIEVFKLSPQLCAARLQEDGLARAARFVLPLLRSEGNAAAAEILVCLPRDPVGVSLEHVVHALWRAHSGRRYAHTVAGFMLDSSMLRGTYALCLRIMDSVRGTRTATVG